MQQSRLRLRIILVAALLAASAGAFTATGWASAGRPFTGDICGLLSASQLAPADITGGCAQSKSSTKTVSTYSAHWGRGNDAHWLMIMITKPAINADFFYDAEKRGASRGRSPIKLGMWAYWKTERYNGDRRRGDIIFRVGPYVCLVSLNDDNGAPDEVGIANSLFSIAKKMVAKLQ